MCVSRRPKNKWTSEVLYQEVVAEAEGGDDSDHGDGGEVRACVAPGGSGSVGWSASAGR